MHTPASVHHGTAREIRALRQATLDAAYTANPDRFRHRRPHPPKLPAAVGAPGSVAAAAGVIALSDVVAKATRTPAIAERRSTTGNRAIARPSARYTQ